MKLKAFGMSFCLAGLLLSFYQSWGIDRKLTSERELRGGRLFDEVVVPYENPVVCEFGRTLNLIGHCNAPYNDEKKGTIEFCPGYARYEMAGDFGSGGVMTILSQSASCQTPCGHNCGVATYYIGYCSHTNPPLNGPFGPPKLHELDPNNPNPPIDP